eukprot:Skav224219  [mRNA]  locus=scaffold939:1040355:1043180:- [translate_table: standard]
MLLTALGLRKRLPGAAGDQSVSHDLTAAPTSTSQLAEAIRQRLQEDDLREKTRQDIQNNMEASKEQEHAPCKKPRLILPPDTQMKSTGPSPALNCAKVNGTPKSRLPAAFSRLQSTPQTTPLSPPPIDAPTDPSTAPKQQAVASDSASLLERFANLPSPIPAAQPPPSPPPPPGPAPAPPPLQNAALQTRLALIAKNNLNQLRKTLTGEQAKRKDAENLCASLQEQLRAMSEENEKLKAQLQVQKSASAISSGASWQYEMDGSWHEFAPEANEKMHQAYLKYHGGQDPNSRFASISSAGVARTVDFERMEQKHPATQKVRPIRLLTGVPPQWTSPPADLLQQRNDLRSFYKEVTDQDIWSSILSILQTTGHALTNANLWPIFAPLTDCSCMGKAEIRSVHRIENNRLWHRYKARLSAMRQDHATYNVAVGPAQLDLDGPPGIMTGLQGIFDCGEGLALDVDEKILLHGTSWDNANAIVREGFDHRTCQNAYYGAGVYFACAACKSHQYTCEQHKPSCRCKHERTLIIARVALGDAYVATETRRQDRRPPVRSDASGTATGTYDSIVVNPGVVKGHFNAQQAHPKGGIRKQVKRLREAVETALKEYLGAEAVRAPGVGQCQLRFGTCAPSVDDLMIEVSTHRQGMAFGPLECGTQSPEQLSQFRLLI